ncbi:MAG: cupin domain-containing protein [Sphaerochaetaceae bacterium]|nr:cupin domain-containing protein [Sphaerochaetaceae bacterium]
MIIENKQQKIDIKTNMRDGKGDVILQQIVDKENLNHSRLFSKITLKKGCSIGTHTHLKETEYYYIIQGEGEVTEKEGSYVARAGDVVITGDQESHSIINKKEEDLVFIALILLDD